MHYSLLYCEPIKLCLVWHWLFSVLDLQTSLVNQPKVRQFAPQSNRCPWALSQTFQILGPIVFGQDIITYAAIVIAVAASWFLFRTRPGLEVRATGDDPATVDAQGLSVASIRIRYTLLGGALVGLGGAFHMLAMSAAWHLEATTNGVGWIALSLVVFAGWRPIRLIFGAILFGFTLQLPFTLQAEQITFIPSAIMPMLPYLATLIALIALSRPGSSNILGAPKALGIPFVRDER